MDAKKSINDDVTGSLFENKDKIINIGAIYRKIRILVPVLLSLGFKVRLNISCFSPPKKKMQQVISISSINNEFFKIEKKFKISL